MKEVNDILKKNNLTCCRYQKKGKCIIADTGTEKKVIKPNKTNIYEYLAYRSFDNYPNLLVDDGYEITDYIDEIDIPVEQKMMDLINVVSLLHKKTTYYKKISEFSIKEIYEDIKHQIQDIKVFYDNLMIEVETSIYMPPSYYLLARNISFVYDMLNYCNTNIDKWYKNIKDTDRVRVAIIHNNLSLDHFKNNLLISWDNAKISLPIFDLYKLYQNTYNEYDWNELLNIYSSNYPLKEDEIFLFRTLIGMPLKPKITKIEIDNVKEINEKLNYLKITSQFLATKKSEIMIET